jgi:hypothetical protein
LSDRTPWEVRGHGFPWVRVWLRLEDADPLVLLRRPVRCVRGPAVVRPRAGRSERVFRWKARS